uniref:Uncharacterized protein n=1 Tax=Anguilla anguilla TaxID=7936 RepID=A0A0E9PRX6_ANGAN
MRPKPKCHVKCSFRYAKCLFLH